MKKIFKTQAFKILCILVALMVIGLAMSLFWWPLFDALYIIFGTFFVIFLPGFIWSYFFFPGAVSVTRFEDNDGEPKYPSLDWIERITLSIVLSLAMVPLCVYITNRLGFPINIFDVFFIIIMLILIGIATLFVRTKELTK